MSDAPIAPTSRTTLRRKSERGRHDAATIREVLDAGLVCHIGFAVDGRPWVFPTAYARVGDDLYVHGAVGNFGLRTLASGVEACVTVTLVDALVLAKSAFHHSMNYRSAVVIGTARVVEDSAERRHALDLIVDHMIPGRSATLRASTRKELAATAVLAVPLHEASMKARAGGPVDEPEDVAAGVWGGHVPVRRVLDAPVADADSPGPIPADVLARAGGR